MPLNPSNTLAALKELYTGDDFMKDLVYAKNPFLALVPKDESPDGMAGKYIPVPIQWGNPTGRSATFATAQTNENQARLSSFFVYRVQNYAVARIANELIEATQGNAGAFVDAAKLAVDSSFRNLSNDLALDLYGLGNGQRGAIGTGFTQDGTVAGGTRIPLSNVEQIVNFEVGMLLRASSTDGGSASDDTVTITNVNRSTGVILGTASAATLVGSWTAGGRLTQDGDISATVASTATGADDQTGFLKVTGLSGWLPSVDPTATTFCGVDRSQDSTRLAGVRFDGTGESVEEALIDGSTRVAREGGQPSMGFCSFATWAALEKELGSKVQYVQVQHDNADIAFKGLTVNAPYGPITMLPDRNCTPRRIYLLSLDSWKLRSLGKAPHILTYGQEGLEALRVGTADSLEVRLGFYGNLVCSAPGWNAVISTAT